VWRRHRDAADERSATCADRDSAASSLAPGVDALTGDSAGDDDPLVNGPLGDADDDGPSSDDHPPTVDSPATATSATTTAPPPTN